MDKFNVRASFEATRRARLFREIVPERCQQKRPKFTVLAIHSLQGFVLKEIKKKTLG
jgi:hypothetical protein